jgi:tetratricopeptide (TPR) repeat protein
VQVGRALGDAFQRQARRDLAQQRALLERAVEWYRRTLYEASADPAALTNLALALKALGNDAELERFLPDAINRDPGGVAIYALLLGDVYRDREAWSAAVGAYQQAIAAAPENEAPRLRMVEAFRHLPDSAASLFALVSRESDWEARFPEATARAYEVVVDALAPRDGKASAAASLRWVSVLSRAQLLSRDRLAVLATSWLTMYLDQLRAFLADPSRAPPTDGFGLWSTPNGREALAQAALAAGRQRLAEGDPVATEAFLRAGLAAADDRVPVALDLALEAAVLYTRLPGLDPSRVKFSELESRLISGKAEAYHRADREAVQRFHTVLGLIYTQRGTFRPAGEPWRSAVYQLKYALRTARERDSVGGFYQPLPELRAFLADAYAVTGVPADRSAYLEAAAAYLDVDALDEAQHMLQRAREASGTETGDTARALQSLIQARVAAAAGATTRRPREECEAAADRSAAGVRAAGLGGPFVKRQQFKLLADCVLAGPAPVRPADAARVLSVAVDEHTQLVGAKDLLRLQRSQAAVLHVVSATPAGATSTPNAARGVRVLLPSESSPESVSVNPDLLLGALVLAEVGADTSLRIQVRDGQVTAISGNPSESARSNLLSKIQAVRGVRSAHVRGPLGTAPPSHAEQRPD